MSFFHHITPEEAGVSPRSLAGVVRELDRLKFMNSMIMLRHGKIFCECSWAPFRAELPHALWSLSKSFVSCAVGIACSEGSLTLEDPLFRFFPEYERFITDEKMKRVTVRDLLTMRSGHKTCAVAGMYAHASGSWARGFLSGTLEYEPGTRFVYNSGATYMLSALLRKATGMNVREYLLPRLFQPMGIAPGIWESCPEGIPFGGWGLYLKIGDLAKFAQLLLNGGLWQGKQLVPAEYLAEATVKHADNSENRHPDWKCGYGYQFWVSRHGFRGDGASGQYAVVLPEYDMAIAVNAGMAEMGTILDLFWEKLLPSVTPAELPADPEGRKELEKLTASLAIPPCAGNFQKRGVNCFWRFAENRAGIRSASLEFGDEECSLTFSAEGGAQQIRAGFGRHLESVVRFQDPIAHPVAASAAWTGEEELEIRLFYLDSTFQDIFTIRCSDPEYPITCECKYPVFRHLFPQLRVLGKNG